MCYTIIDAMSVMLLINHGSIVESVTPSALAVAAKLIIETKLFIVR